MTKSYFISDSILQGRDFLRKIGANFEFLAKTGLPVESVQNNFYRFNMFQKLGSLIKNSLILAQVSIKNSVSILVLNSIIDVEKSVSFLRHRHSS